MFETGFLPRLIYIEVQKSKGCEASAVLDDIQMNYLRHRIPTTIQRYLPAQGLMLIPEPCGRDMVTQSNDSDLPTVSAHLTLW